MKTGVAAFHLKRSEALTAALAHAAREVYKMLLAMPDDEPVAPGFTDRLQGVLMMMSCNCEHNVGLPAVNSRMRASLARVRASLAPC